jgi:hypothetical protein
MSRVLILIIVVNDGDIGTAARAPIDDVVIYKELN